MPEMAFDQIRITDRFSSVLKPLTPARREKLKQQIRQDAIVYSPLIVWEETGELIDGMHRYQILQELAESGEEIDAVPYGLSFGPDTPENYQHVCQWIRDTNDARRQNSDYEKLEAYFGRSSAAQDFKNSDTIDKIASDMGLGRSKVVEAKAISRDAPEEAKQKVRDGEISIHEAHQQTRKPRKPRKITTPPTGPVDKEGHPIERPEVQDAFEDARAYLHKLHDLLMLARRMLNEWPNHPSAILLQSETQPSQGTGPLAGGLVAWRDFLHRLAYHLDAITPYAVTPDTKLLQGKQSEEARKRGWVTKQQWDALQKANRA